MFLTPDHLAEIAAIEVSRSQREAIIARWRCALTIAGIPDDEALRIATQAEADRAAETELTHRRHAA